MPPPQKKEPHEPDLSCLHFSQHSGIVLFKSTPRMTRDALLTAFECFYSPMSLPTDWFKMLMDHTARLITAVALLFNIIFILVNGFFPVAISTQSLIQGEKVAFCSY